MYLILKRQTKTLKDLIASVRERSTFRKLSISYALSVSTSLVSSLFGFFYLIFSTGFLFPTLGTQRFGVWVTVFSLVSALSFLDLGVGNAALNSIAKASRKNDRQALRVHIHAALVFSCISAGIVLFAVFLLLSNFHVDLFFKGLSASNQQEAHNFLICFAILYALNFPLSVLGKAVQGIQKSWIVHVTRAIGTALAIAGVWVGQRLDFDLAGLLLASYGMQTGTGFILIGVALLREVDLFEGTRLSRLLPFSLRLAKVGSAFLLLQLSMTFGWLLDYTILSSVVGLEAAAQFGVLQRMFQVVTVVSSLMNGQLWPIYAFIHGSDQGINLRRMVVIAILATFTLSSALSATIFIFRDWIADIWIKSSVDGMSKAYAVYAVLIVIESLGSSLSIYLNATNKIGRQIIAAMVYALTGFALKLWLAPMYSVQGIVVATLVSYSLGQAILAISLRTRR